MNLSPQGARTAKRTAAASPESSKGGAVCVEHAAERSIETIKRHPGDAGSKCQSQPPKIRLLLVDDNAVIRLGMAALFKDQDDIDLVGEAADGLAALELVRQLRPSVVLMDVNMPRMDGMEATARITREFPEIRVVAISMHDQQRVGNAMLQAGAWRFLSKNAAAEDLVAAVRGLSD